MAKSRWRSLRWLLVCAVLAFTSAPPRVVGWFESVVQIAGAARMVAAADLDKPSARSVGTASPGGGRASEGRPGARDRTGTLASRRSRWIVQVAAAFEASVRAAAESPNTDSFFATSPLYLRNSALLC